MPAAPCGVSGVCSRAAAAITSLPLALAARTILPVGLAGHHHAASAPAGLRLTPKRPSRHKAMQVRPKART